MLSIWRYTWVFIYCVSFYRHFSVLTHKCRRNLRLATPTKVKHILIIVVTQYSSHPLLQPPIRSLVIYWLYLHQPPLYYSHKFMSHRRPLMRGFTIYFPHTDVQPCQLIDQVPVDQLAVLMPTCSRSILCMDTCQVCHQQTNSHSLTTSLSYLPQALFPPHILTPHALTLRKPKVQQ